MSDLVGRVLRDRYRLVAPIGAGASARVYLADDVELRRRVAVKLLHPGLSDDAHFLARFRAEARAAAALSHPNILAVHDWGEDDGTPFLVTEFLAGGSLRAVLDSGDRLTPSQALVVGLDAARGLDHAHRQGLVHRDIKPANLLFGEDRRLRIADFGLARALAESGLTEPDGTLRGTPRYASPEQARGENVTGSADVYSLALTLVESVTGSVPFAADTALATLMARTEANLAVGPELGSMRRVLERAGRLDPAMRPDSGELEIALMAAAEDMVRPEPIALPGVFHHDTLSTAGWDDTVVVDLGGATGPGATAADVAADSAAARTAALFDQDASSSPASPTPVLELKGRRRRRWPKVLLAIVLVLLLAGGGGAAWWFLVRVPTFAVPSLVGEQLTEVERAAAAHDWVVDASRTARQDGTNEGEVLSQSPLPGSQLEEGGRLRVTISLGNELGPLPLVVGVDEATATQALLDADLALGDVTHAFDEEMGVGLVVSATPQVEPVGPDDSAPAAAPGGPDDALQVPHGTAVDLVISDGPAPRTVPGGLVGGTPEAAVAAVESVQLVPAVREDWSETVPTGQVVVVNPAEGSAQPRGTPVEIVVSKGPQPITVPSLQGVTGTEAAAQLEALGFVVSGIEGSPSREVLATDPPAGEAHARGTVIRIFTRS